MTKQTLSDAVQALSIVDLNEIKADDYKALISTLDIKFHLIDYHQEQEAMHVIVSHDKQENMYELLFVHIAHDYSSYQLTVVEVTSSLHDAIQAMSNQLIIDLCEFEAQEAQQ